MALPFLLGFLSLILWIYIFYSESKYGLGWFSPIALYAGGILIFYVIPTLYWLIRPWQSSLPSYLDGVWLVLLSTIILSVPFIYNSYNIKRRLSLDFSLIVSILKTRSKIVPLVFSLVSFICIYFELSILELGNQSRLGTKQLDLFGSSDLGYLIINNVVSIWPICYLYLITFTEGKFKKLGIILLMIDGVLSISTLQRTQILNFILYVTILLGILGHKITLKKLFLLFIFISFTIAILGITPNAVKDLTEINKRTHLDFVDVTSVLIDTSLNSSLNVIDSTDLVMERLFEARSASAVMINVPNKIDYQYGSTLLHLFYSLIPRFIWQDKPSLREIHLFTDEVMPNDLGLNPLGTVAEFYINGSFIGVFIGGLLSLIILKSIEKLFFKYFYYNNINKFKILLIIYPLLSLWIFGAAYNFTQRVSEGLRFIVLFYFLLIFFSMVRRCTKY